MAVTTPTLSTAATAALSLLHETGEIVLYDLYMLVDVSWRASIARVIPTNNTPGVGTRVNLGAAVIVILELPTTELTRAETCTPREAVGNFAVARPVVSIPRTFASFEIQTTVGSCAGRLPLKLSVAKKRS